MDYDGLAVAQIVNEGAGELSECVVQLYWCIPFWLCRNVQKCARNSKRKPVTQCLLSVREAVAGCLQPACSSL